MALSLLFAIPGIALMLANYLLFGLGLLMLGWWIYERAGLRDSTSLTDVLLVAGGIGALKVIWEFVAQALNRL